MRKVQNDFLKRGHFFAVSVRGAHERRERRKRKKKLDGSLRVQISREGERHTNQGDLPLCTTRKA